MVYKKPETEDSKWITKKEQIEVFDKKTGKNVFISKDKLLDDEGRYSPKKEGSSNWITKKEKSEGGIVKRYKGGLMVKPKAAKRGY
jgi:hypothetical protein